jgi:hypothetical protein
MEKEHGKLFLFDVKKHLDLQLGVLWSKAVLDSPG